MFTDNIEVVVFNRGSMISSKAFSTQTEGLPERGLTSRLVSLSMKHLNQFYATRWLMVPGPSTKLIFSDLAFIHFLNG